MPSMANILLAEDEPINAQMAAFICRRAGHHVRVAADGLRALELLAESPFDLALIDILMPGLDGVGLTRLIRLDPRHREMPIIGMTALAGRDDQAAMLAAGMTRVITKPCRAGDIEAAIRAVLPPP